MTLGQFLEKFKVGGAAIQTHSSDEKLKAEQLASQLTGIPYMYNADMSWPLVFVRDNGWSPREIIGVSRQREPEDVVEFQWFKNEYYAQDADPNAGSDLDLSDML